MPKNIFKKSKNISQNHLTLFSQFCIMKKSRLKRGVLSASAFAVCGRRLRAANDIWHF
jgi:hypothetical protein